MEGSQTCLNKNKSKIAYQPVKEQISGKRDRTTTVRDMSFKISDRRTRDSQKIQKYCLELYNHESYCDDAVLYLTALPTHKNVYNKSLVMKLRLQ